LQRALRRSMVRLVVAESSRQACARQTGEIRITQPEALEVRSSDAHGAQVGDEPVLRVPQLDGSIERVMPDVHRDQPGVALKGRKRVHVCLKIRILENNGCLQGTAAQRGTANRPLLVQNCEAKGAENSSVGAANQALRIRAGLQ